MLRAKVTALTRAQIVRSAALLHTAAPVLAAKPVKALAQGFKKGEGKKNKKTSGSHKFFEDFVSGGRFNTKAVELDAVPLSAELPINTVAKYSDAQFKRLVHAGSFKMDQFNELFSRPITLVRDETIEMINFIEKSQSTPSSDNRVCFIGEPGIGKSSLLAQTHALLPQDSIIIPISYGIKLVDGTNDFWHDASLEAYTQPMYLKKLLTKIRHVNHIALSKISLSQEYPVENIIKGRPPIKFNSQNNLLQVLNTRFSARQRGTVFEILMNELVKQTAVPVYLTVDNFGGLTSNPLTKYRNVENKPIYVEELQIAKKIFELTSGDLKFAKGGVILSTSSDDVSSVTLDAGLGLTKPDAYLKVPQYHPQLSSRLAGVKPFTVGKLSKENVGSLVEALIEAKAFRKDELATNQKQNLIDQKYVLSGNGNPLELFKSVTMFY